jgi:uncharacterized membrane protein YfcA
MVQFAQSLSGFAVGVIVGLTGVGGGSLMTPILVLLFGIHPATAVGTDLLHAAITKSGGTWVYARRGDVQWRVTALLAAGSLPAAICTLFVLHRFMQPPENPRILTTALGLALLITAFAMLWRARLRRLSRVQLDAAPRHPALTVITGALLGVLVTLSSVGAGALGIAALLFLYPRLPAVRLVAADLAHAVPLTLVAGVGYWLFGDVNWTLLGSLLIGSLPGIYLGSRFAGRLPERLLRLLLALTLLLVAGKLLLY